MAQGGAQVLVLALQPLDGGELAGAAQQRVGGAGEFAVVRLVRAPGLRALSGLVEPFAGVLGDGLQEPVAHLAVARGSGHDQRLVDEGAERLQGGRPADGLGGGEVAAAREDRQPPQHLAFVLVEQLPGPVDDGPQRLLAGQDGAAAGGEQAEAVVEPVGDLPRGEHAQAGGGEFDGEGQTVEAPADLGAPLRVVLDLEPRPRGGSPVGEQPQRDRLGQWVHGAQQLPGYAEGFAAGGHDRQPRAALQQLLDEAGGGLDDVLAVVEDQQHPALAAVLGEPLDGVVGPVGSGPHGLGAGAVEHGLAGAHGGEHGLRYGRGVVDRRELGQPHPVRCPVPHPLGGLLRQPGLPGTAGTEQGDKPGGGEVAADGIDVALAADEGGEAGAEVARGRGRGGGAERVGGGVRGAGRGAVGVGPGVRGGGPPAGGGRGGVAVPVAVRGRDSSAGTAREARAIPVAVRGRRSSAGTAPGARAIPVAVRGRDSPAGTAREVLAVHLPVRGRRSAAGTAWGARAVHLAVRGRDSPVGTAVEAVPT